MKTIIKRLKTCLQRKLTPVQKLRHQLLHEIGQKNEVGIAKLFVQASEKERSAILNPRIDYRSTSYTEDPLHFAIHHKLTQSIQLFLPYIKNINRQPYAVGTPLHAASQHGLTKVVKLLLSREDIDVNAKNCIYGAGPFGGDRRYRTALQALIDYLQQYGDNDQSRKSVAKLLLKDKRLDKQAMTVKAQQIVKNWIS